MSESDVAPGGSEPIAVVTPASEGYSSASEAARELASYRWKRDNPEQSAEAPAEADSTTESAQAEDAAPPQEEPGAEQTQEAEPDDHPPIEPPRSWTKEEKERFQTLPRETQDYLARREQERERDFRTRQNEAAEQRKVVDTERQKAEQARQQYEQALPALLNTLSAKMQGEFSDVRTFADVQKLAAEDPFRFTQYQAKQMEIAAVAQEAKQAQDRQTSEYQSQWQDWSSKEDAAFAERVPEIRDNAKASSIREGAVNLLKDVGFSESDLANLWEGKNSVSLRDHRVQLLIRDAVAYREAKKVAAQPPKAKPAPHVQRPGVAPPRNAAAGAQIQALATKLETTGSWRDAAALLSARRAVRK